MDIIDFLTKTYLGKFIFGFVPTFIILSIICLIFKEFNDYIYTILACSSIGGLWAVVRI